LVVHQELCQRIKQSCYSIKVYLDEQPLSDGTAFAFLPSGELLTAGHVITGRFPIRREDVRDPSVKIFGQAPSSALREYSIGFCGITIQSVGFVHPLQVDIGVLVPTEKLQTPVPYLPTKANHIPELGEQVLIAGFSEEIKLPFNFDRSIDRQAVGAADFLRAMRLGYEAQMGSLMIKSGIVGNVRSFEASSSETTESVAGDIFYIDNSLHFGASGGPVVTASGDVIGIVSERAVTDASNADQILKVPSGSALAISTRVLVSLNTIIPR
jgi:hypothetical protein